MSVRFPMLAALSFALAAPAAAQPTAQQAYDDFFKAYGGRTVETYPEYIAGFTLDGHFASILKETPDLKAHWSEADTRTAVAEFGAPIRTPYKALVMRRLIAALPIGDAQAATALAGDAAGLKTIECVGNRPGRTASDWAACAGDGGRSFGADEQALATRAITALNTVMANPDLNSSTVGIICHTLDRFSERVSTDGMKRKYSMTLSVVAAEEPMACDRGKARYAALIGHDAYLKLEPSLSFERREDD